MEVKRKADGSWKNDKWKLKKWQMDFKQKSDAHQMNVKQTCHYGRSWQHDRHITTNVALQITRKLYSNGGRQCNGRHTAICNATNCLTMWHYNLQRCKSPKSSVVMACRRFFFFCLTLHLALAASRLPPPPLESLRAKEREKETETTTFHNIGDGAYDGGEQTTNVSRFSKTWPWHDF